MPPRSRKPSPGTPASRLGGNTGSLNDATLGDSQSTISEDCIDNVQRLWGWVVEPYERGSRGYNPTLHHINPDVDYVGSRRGYRGVAVANPCPCDAGGSDGGGCEWREHCSDTGQACAAFRAWAGRQRGSGARTAEQIAALERIPDRILFEHP